MPAFSRRNFLSTSFGGLSAAALAGNFAFAEDALPAAKGPESLFLTWRTDPTTTITIQWVGPEVAADSSIRFALASDKENASKWQSEKPQLRPFPSTVLKVHRCELTGLAPGT